MKAKRYPDVEANAIHWVGNLPDATAQAMVESLRRRCPIRIKTAKDFDRLQLYTYILIQVIENRGHLPQNQVFQDYLRIRRLNAWKISRLLDRVYNSLPQKLKELRA